MRFAKHFLFRNEYIKFNNTGVLDSIYHMTLKLIKNHKIGVEMLRFCHRLCNVIMAIIT